ncbi:MOSC domain-containing protein [Janthinobacterium sp. CG3]|uniref:MOSC domain-containing protein n=1 Tax=Janthinobacterium sp. CG3 TaxID=1075768 RepID=UPI00037ECF46|nr:MOSC domain-containing protein [Janthinobacterium sp. CG3]
MDKRINVAEPVAAIGTVRSLRVRSARSAQPGVVPAAVAIAGVGLDGDVHADTLSPRQVLLAGVHAYDQYRLEANALRENLLLDLDSSVLRSGALLRIGPQAVLWLTFQCEPCGHLDAHQPGLSKRIGAHRGMLARVVRGGEVRPGDAVACLQRSLPGWSDDWRERVVRILQSVPDDMVLEYKQLARLAGVSTSYCRVFPRMARDLGLSEKLVPMRSQSGKARWEGSELFDVEQGRR